MKEGAAYPDGRLIIWAGDLASADGERVPGIVRLLADGSIDHSFSAGTGFHAQYFPELNFEVNDILIQPDEHILVAGTFVSYDGKKADKVVRLNPDGTIDPSFNAQATGPGIVFDLELQADGKILVSGGTHINEKTPGALIRLNADGSLDQSFVLGESFQHGNVYSTKVQSDGKIVAIYDPVVSTGFSYLQRFNTDGSADTPFKKEMTDRGATQFDFQMVDGQQYIVLLNTGWEFLGRFKPDGTRDAGFLNGFQSMDPQSIFIINNEIYCYGQTVSRVMDNGLRDDASPKIYRGPRSWITYAGNGNFYLSSDGRLDTHAPLDLFKINLTGDDVAGFDANLARTATISGVVPVEAQKVILFGDFDRVNDAPEKNIVLLDDHGSVDPSFTAGNLFNDAVRTVVRQPDGNLIVAGDFTSFDGMARYCMVRLHADGTLDDSFQAPAFLADGKKRGYTITLLTDGKMLVQISGSLSIGNGIEALFRLNPDGSLDRAFPVSHDINNLLTLITVAPEADGKVMALLNGSDSKQYLKRYESDGTLTDVGSLDVYLRLGNGEKPNVDGTTFYGFSGVASPTGGGGATQLVRLKPDGKKDESFSPFFFNLPNRRYNASRFQDKIAVFGLFERAGVNLTQTETTGYPIAKLALVDMQGNVMPGFSVPIDGIPSNLVQINDTDFMLTGPIKSVDGEHFYGAAWLTVAPGLPKAPSNVQAVIENNRIKMTWSDNANNETGFEIQRLDRETQVYTAIALTGADVTALLDTANIANQNFFLRIRAVNAAGASAFVDFNSIILDAAPETKTEMISVYPNPARNVVAISGASVRETNVTLVDTMGKEVQFRWLDENTIDISGTPPGVYILSVATENGVVARKIVKEK
ncbi:T9SS type A sorting domain-containing protein [Chryseolinea serpens]|uniref:T9SS type A sorting domain-containing protein n=1 Tax=Chryseolinea serpens TaxID=947013 RepID=UPI0015C1449D|nr:T9SS type A sorting domain-containing protein [Chryseolinea serpens]